MSEPFIGQIILFSGNFAIRNWAKCDGQLLAISQHPKLFSIVGTTYGGDGRTTFALPDLRGRLPVHCGTGPGLTSVQLGQKGGAPQVTLTADNLPSHSHGYSIPCATDDGSQSNPEDNYPAGSGEDIYSDSNDSAMGSAITNSVGAGQPLNIMNPFSGMNFLIALAGKIPNRSE